MSPSFEQLYSARPGILGTAFIKQNKVVFKLTSSPDDSHLPRKIKLTGPNLLDQAIDVTASQLFSIQSNLKYIKY